MTDKPTKPTLRISFDLLANAKDSLAHAVFHLSNNSGPSRWKIAIREVAHVIELLLKERLRREHPALIWAKVDEYPSLDARTVGTGLAATRLSKLCNIAFHRSDLDTLESCRKLRNKIEHFEFHIDEIEARGIVGRMLSFIFVFSSSHLKLDLEAEFRKDKTWKWLIDLIEFREAQSSVIVTRQKEAGTAAIKCESCGEPTFNIEGEKCELCGHEDARIECENCKETVWASATQEVGDPEEGYAGIICNTCIDNAGDDYDPGGDDHDEER